MFISPPWDTWPNAAAPLIRWSACRGLTSLSPQLPAKLPGTLVPTHWSLSTLCAAHLLPLLPSHPPPSRLPRNLILLTNCEISCLGWICRVNCPTNETVCSLYSRRTEDLALPYPGTGQVNVLRLTVDKRMNSAPLSNQAYKQLGIQTVTACVSGLRVPAC